MTKIQKVFLIALFLGSIILGFAASKLLFKSPVIQPDQIESTLTPTVTPPPNPSSPGLTKVIDEALLGTHGTYGIVVKDLKTKESFFQNEHRVFAPASIYKLWVLGAAFQQIQNGQLNENAILTASAADLNKKFSISDEDAEITNDTISLSVRDALTQMITISDNYAALLLTDKVGISAVGTFLQKSGLWESKVGPGQEDPATTPGDTALFLEKLYNGELADQKYSKEMTDILKWQKLNDGLPKYLPNGVIVAHKTGELDTNTHDAGIVYTDIGDYIVIIFSESNSRDQAKERIAKVSQAVYDYFSSQSPPEKR